MKNRIMAALSAIMKGIGLDSKIVTETKYTTTPAPKPSRNKTKRSIGRKQRSLKQRSNRQKAKGKR